MKFARSPSLKIAFGVEAMCGIRSILKNTSAVLALLILGYFPHAFAALGPGNATASVGDYAASPPLAVQNADPFLMIDLSVELTQQAEAYTDGPQTYGNTVCPDRLYSQSTPWGNRDIGVCYTASEKYIGYFDSEKCYSYDTSDTNTNTDQLATGPRSNAHPHFFKPIGKATNHICASAFSGNFLNWATMSALDEFRSAMTGGARITDAAGSAANTLLIRTRRYDVTDHWPFVMKAIKAGGLTATKSGVSKTFSTTPSTVTPFDLSASSSSTTSVENVTSSTSTCSKKSGAGSGSTATCTTVTTVSYAATDAVYIVNDWSQISPAPTPSSSYQSVRFYSFPSATTTTKKTAVTYKSDGSVYDTTVTGPTTVGPVVVAHELQPGNGATTGFNVIVKACDPGSSAVTTGGIESNCVRYTDGTNTWYKPEGLLQKNALKMKYALTSYTGRAGNAINGGVLRANAKYIGTSMPTSGGGIQANPNAEVNASGQFVFDPDHLAGKVGVNNVAPVNSGIINYINQFALFNSSSTSTTIVDGTYKSNDPDAELYYEGLRYTMHMGPTPSFSHPTTALTANEQDGYPVFAGLSSDGAGSPAWSDPVVSSCQKNFALYVGDKNTWMNDYLPGGTSLDATNDPVCVGECTDAFTTKGINVTSLENDIGSRDGGGANHPYSPTHGDGLAALAWWAHTHDIRTDITGAQKLKTFIVDTQEFGGSNAIPVGTDNTLWRAAKWGGFEDTNNDVFGAAAVPSPDLLNEWNAKGASFNGTPIPDTYTLASQPANLVAGLTSAFDQVLQKTSAAAAAAVVANSSVGTASIYQALYQPRTSNNTTAVTWTGLVRSFFIDDLGRIREDTDHDHKLTNADYVLQFTQDSVNQTAIVNRYTVGGTYVDTVSLSQVNPIWDASKTLASLTNAQAQTQRSYLTTADQGRYIITWVDANNNGVIDSGEVQDFTASNFPVINASSNDSTFDPARMLGLDSSVLPSPTSGSNALKLVNYIRGVDQTGYRNRTIDLGDGSGLQTQRLGDIVHSAPLVVGAPNQSYDVAYGDTTYQAFKQRYAGRRQVLYAGANDGMLHAFNAGFFDPASNGFYTASNVGTGAETKHPLGSELWAYVPYNLLPQLQWLTDPAYQHTYYVDGTPQSFDVNIFTDSCANVTTCKHPYGWGTVLVVGFRFGGGDITVNATTDQTGPSDPGNRTLRSAYLVFDITDPEQPPTLLGELSQPSLGFTVSRPALVKHRVAVSGSFASLSAANNQWYLVMGSGPVGSDSVTKQDALLNAQSNQQAGIYVYDLTANSWVDANTLTGAVDPFPVTGATNNSFVGDMTSQDWGSDYTDEVIYFGTVGGPVSNPTGDLMRMVMPSNYVFGSPTISRVLTSGNASPAQPFSMAPLAVRDVTGQPWVYAGTGRFFTSSDILSAKQMSYYGVKEPAVASVPSLNSQVDKSALINTTGIQVFSDGTVKDATGSSLVINSQSIPNYSSLTQTVANASGWYFNFSGLAERDVDVTEQFFDSLFITAYTTSGDSCAPLGSSRRIAASLLTGTATPSSPLGFNSATHQINFSSAFGIGQFFSSGIVAVGSGSNKIYLDITQGSMSDSYAYQRTHSSSNYGRRMSWRELPTQ